MKSLSCSRLKKKAVIPPEANLVEPINAIPIEVPLPVPNESPTTNLKTATTFKRSREELGRMKVVKLRNIARGIEGLGIDRSRIKFSNKEELITAILATYDRR